jgi:hypothetical protein
MAAEINKYLKGEYSKRAYLAIFSVLYLFIFIGNLDRELLMTYRDLKIKDSFKLIKIKTDSLIYSGSGGASGTKWTITIKIGNDEKSLIKGYHFSTNQDFITVLNSKYRKDYVYNYSGPNFWAVKRNMLIFKIVYFFLVIPYFYFFRKQHFKVKRLAPYGVDENYEPLPKPAEKINFNKYD